MLYLDVFGDLAALNMGEQWRVQTYQLPTFRVWPSYGWKLVLAFCGTCKGRHSLLLCFWSSRQVTERYNSIRIDKMICQ